MSTVSRLIKAIVVFVILVAFFALFFTAVIIIKHQFEQNNQPQLPVVQNVRYEEDNWRFAWDTIERDDCNIEYIVSINGEEKNVGSATSCFFTPAEGATEIKVKAIDTFGGVKDSEWSDVCKYAFKESEIINLSTYEYINNFIKSFADLKEIVSICLYEGSIYVQLVGERKGTNYLYNVEITYEDTIESLKDAIEKEHTNCFNTNIGTAVNYDSARYMLESNSLTEQLQSYIDQGYSISVVNAQAVQLERYKDGSNYYIYGTYKLEKNGEVKYIQATHKIAILNKTITSENFTTNLLSSKNRVITEVSCNELTGDFAVFAENMDKLANGE